MKNLGLIIFLFLVLGCTSPQEISDKEETEATLPSTIDHPPQTISSVPSDTPSAESQAIPLKPRIIDHRPKTTNKQLTELLTKAEKTVKSYEFTYAPPPDNLARDRYAIKGSKTSVKKIYRPIVVKPTEYADTIYLNAEQGTAVAFCEERGTVCMKARQNYPVNYNDYVIKTPMDWLQEIEEGDVKGPHYLFERQTYQVTYDKEGKDYFFWIDARYGLVVRVVIDDRQEKERYDYLDLVVNQVKDSDVMPKT